MKDNREEIRLWMKQLVDSEGRGVRQRLAHHLGVRPDAITRMLNPLGKEHRDVKADELVKIGHFFNAVPPGLTELPEVLRSSIGMRAVKVAGVAEAGMFREVDDLNQDEAPSLSLPADERFSNARQFLVDVAGDSMNNLRPRPILPGDRALCVAYEDVASEAPLRDGMVVVVERTRDAGQYREWSIKQIEIYKDRTEFHPRSTNPRHKAIVVEHNTSADTGQGVEIIGLVRRVINDIAF